MPCSGFVVESTFILGAGPVIAPVTEMETAQFECPTAFNETVLWKVRTILRGVDGEHRQIYRNGLLVATFKNTGRYSVTYKAGVYTLTIINVTVTDAGEYRCIEEEGINSTSSAFLKVKG